MSSEVKRYEVAECFVIGGCSEMQESPSGHYVEHSDYATLEAECERLRLKVMVWNDGKPYAALKAERNALAAQLAEVKEQSETRWAGYVRVSNRMRELEAECERWKERCQYNADTAHAVAAERDALLAELAAIKGQEPDCDRSACGDFSPGRCDNPECSARRDRKAAAARCSCPSGDGSLAWPCPQHPETAEVQ